MQHRHRMTFAAVALLAVPALAQEAASTDDAPKPEEIALTVYSSADPASFDPAAFAQQQNAGWNPYFARSVPGFGVVKEVRSLDLAAGTSELRLTDVAAFIDPTTVTLADLSGMDTTVLEQAFEFDLVSPQKLLERYVGQEIAYLDRQGADAPDDRWVKGEVLAVNGDQVVLSTNDGIRFIKAHDPNIRLPKLSDGLVATPTLVWKLAAEQAGARKVRTTYQTAGLTWRADYHLTLDEAGDKARLGAWVTLMNVSGAGYPNAHLELIAGDVQRIQPQQPGWGGMRGRMEMDGASSKAGFEQRSFYEYHLYSLPRRTHVKANSTQQIALFPTVEGVTTEKLYVYDGVPAASNYRFSRPHTNQSLGLESSDDVDVYVRFENEQSNRLGMPLPKGKVRVYVGDAQDGDAEFVGEDLIDHTPKDEEVMIRTGNAFDVVGERTPTDFSVDNQRRTMTETFRIELRNRKDVAVKVLVKETLYRWTNWEITQNSDPFTKRDVQTVHFDVTVPAGGERVVTYTARYTW